MFSSPDTTPSVRGSLARAAAFTVLSTAVAAGLHHATGDAPVSPVGIVIGAVVMFLCAMPAFHIGTRAATVVMVIVQAALPTWLNASESWAAPDGHHRLPPSWHHNSPTMAVLHLIAVFGLAWLLHSACHLPAQLLRACAEPARQWMARVAKALGLCLPQPQVAAGPTSVARAPEALPCQTEQFALRHLRVPCGP